MSARKPRPSVAIVEPDAAVRQRLAAGLRGEFSVLEAEDYDGAHRLLQDETPDILLLDAEPERGGLKRGIELIRELEQSEADTIVIAMIAGPQKSAALKVMEAGAYDYFSKPVDPDVLRVILNRAVEKQGIERENEVLRVELLRQQSFGDLIGGSAGMQDVYEAIRRVADSNATVIVRGESGTGKELVARSLHERSGRAKGPFLGVNCGALPEPLMEAELFGYEKGAFTGAAGTKEGRFELADGGTLFLDEIGTLTLPLQAKLLRVLEEREFMRLGGKRSVKVDVRLITATNEDLEERVARKRFREDLYYRIQVVPIQIPPLRERREDIPLLVGYFLQVHCVANHVPLKRLDEAALRALEAYSWPGNVREMQNVVQRTVLMTQGSVIGVKNLPPALTGASTGAGVGHFHIPTAGIDLDERLSHDEEQWLKAALAQSHGVKAEAARLLGLNRDRLKYLCRKHRL